MKIQVMSDLHREFYGGGGWQPKINPEADYLILAGDTHTKPFKFAKFLNKIASKFDGQIICIPGNHEYYRNKFPTAFNEYKKEVNKQEHANRINLLNDQYLCPNDSEVMFLCGTLWTDFDNERDMVSAQLAMNDYLFIKNESGRKINTYDVLEEHKNTLAFFEKTLDGTPSDKKVIMVTHHGPSYRSVPSVFRGNNLNGAYVTSLEWFVEKYEPAVWIHGHTHHFFDYQLGPTRVVCNPVGYPHEDNYKENYIIEV